MSGLIPDMKMPASCQECPMADTVTWCCLNRKYYSWGLTERPSDCPLIPIVDTTLRCPHCGGKIERRGSEWYCHSCHFWWEAEDDRV